MNIHPTAIVHPKAKIGKGTVVGPWVLIEEGAQIGEDCEIRARAVVTGHVRMGKKNQVGYGAIIGAEPQDLAFKDVKSFVEIGDNNVFRENTTVHRGTKEKTSTKVGNNNFLMAGAHVAHNCEIGDHVILVNNVLLAGYVTIQDRAFLGGDVVVHQYTRIGQLAMVRGQTRIGMDVPPFFMAVATNAVCGLNRVGLRRAGYTPQQRKAILKAYEILYSEGLNRQQVLEKLSSDSSLKTPEVRLIKEFISETKRGICHAIKAKHAKGKQNDEE